MNVTKIPKIPKKTISVIEPKRSLIVNREQYHQRRVAAYCRVSTDSEEQLTSYTNQKKVYTEMIAAKPEWEFAGLYADEGISGTRADKRPQFQKMINDCLSGKIDYIITKSVSRFARNTVDCLDHVRMLKARGIGIYFEEQNIDTLQIDSELYLVIYAGFAQSESESISKNVTWTFRKRFQDGKPIFNYKCLLGYRKGADGEPEIVPEEAVIVERIFKESVESGDGIEGHEAEFKELSDTIELLQGRIKKLEEALLSDQGNDDRILQLQQIIEDRAARKMEYDDTIVHQMIECVKVYPDGRLDIIFGGGYLIEEHLEEEIQ